MWLIYLLFIILYFAFTCDFTADDFSKQFMF